MCIIHFIQAGCLSAWMLNIQLNFLLHLIYYKGIYSYQLSNKEKIMSYNTADNTAVLLSSDSRLVLKTIIRHTGIEAIREEKCRYQGHLSLVRC